MSSFWIGCVPVAHGALIVVCVRVYVPQDLSSGFERRARFAHACRGCQWLLGSEWRVKRRRPTAHSIMMEWTSPSSAVVPTPQLPNRTMWNLVLCADQGNSGAAGSERSDNSVATGGLGGERWPSNAFQEDHPQTDGHGIRHARQGSVSTSSQAPFQVSHWNSTNGLSIVGVPCAVILNDESEEIRHHSRAGRMVDVCGGPSVVPKGSRDGMSNAQNACTQLP